MGEEIVKCYCPKCRQHTRHSVMASYVMHSEPDSDVWWREVYRMVKCCGCEHVCFDIESEDESNVDYGPNGEEFTYAIHYSYPEKEGVFTPVQFTWNFPTEVYSIYKETVAAINQDCKLLAAAGFRAVIEAICNDKGVTGKNLELKINGLKRSGYITEADRNRFHSVRFLGNDSIHSIKMPSKEALVTVLQIIDGILTNLYVFDEKVHSHLECPISTFAEFTKLLDDGLQNHCVGDVDILKNLLPENCRKLIKEDLPKFENELKLKITEGTYTKLSLCPPPANGRNQQYKVLSL